MTCTAERRTALYRFYDAHEMLLYVGITKHVGRRWDEHMRSKPWYPYVRHQAVTWYDTERRARKAETLAIRTEHPKYNVAGALRPAERRFNLRHIPIGASVVTWLCVPAVAAGAARLSPALDPLVSVTVLSVPVLLAAVVVVRCTPWFYRFGCWLDRNFGRDPVLVGAPAGTPLRAGRSAVENHILALVAAGHSPSKAGKLAGRSDSYGRKVVRTAKDLARTAPKGQDPEE